MAVEPLVALLRARARTADVIVTSFMERIVRQLRRAGPELPLAPGRPTVLVGVLREPGFRPRPPGR